MRCAGEIAKLAGRAATPRTERTLSTHALVYTPHTRSGLHSQPSGPTSTMRAAEVGDRVRTITTERLSGVLAVFAHRSVATLVFPTFGAGTFQHTPPPSRVCAELLLTPRAPFKGVFEYVVFAIPSMPGEEFGAALWTSAGANMRSGRGEETRARHGNQAGYGTGNGWLSTFAANSRSTTTPTTTPNGAMLAACVLNGTGSGRPLAP